MALTNPNAFAPPGWNYSAVKDAWYDSQGRYVTKTDVINHGSIFTTRTIFSFH